MKYAKTKWMWITDCYNIQKAINELPKHCWIITAWDYKISTPYQIWYNVVLDVTLKLYIQHHKLSYIP